MAPAIGAALVLAAAAYMLWGRGEEHVQHVRQEGEPVMDEAEDEKGGRVIVAPTRLALHRAP